VNSVASAGVRGRSIMVAAVERARGRVF